MGSKQQGDGEECTMSGFISCNLHQILLGLSY